MAPRIILAKDQPRFGYIKGQIGDFEWYALVHKELVDNAVTTKLEQGKGHITRLCIYKEVIEGQGKYYTPRSGTQIKRYIYANFKADGWDVLNANYTHMTKQLIDYLDRRSSIKIINCKLSGAN